MYNLLPLSSPNSLKLLNSSHCLECIRRELIAEQGEVKLTTIWPCHRTALRSKARVHYVECLFYFARHSWGRPWDPPPKLPPPTTGMTLRNGNENHNTDPYKTYPSLPTLEDLLIVREILEIKSSNHTKSSSE